MFYKEFTRTKNSQTWFLPWGYPIEEGIVINKNGSLSATFEFRGADLDSSTQEELNIIESRCNNVFKRLSDGFVFHIEANRSKSKNYEKVFSKLIPVELIEIERETFFQSGDHFESKYHLTITYLLPEITYKKATSFFFKKEDEEIIEDFFQEELKSFKNVLEEIRAMFSELFKDFNYLNTTEQLSYYHSCCSDTDFKIEIPKTNQLIDSYISDSPIVGGLKPKLGEKHFRAISILNFPNESYTGMLDRLNRLPIEYRWSTRFITMPKILAMKELASYFRQWDAKRINFIQLIKETFGGGSTKNVNVDAINKSSDLMVEQTLVEGEEVGLGYYTSTVLIFDTSIAKLEKKATLVKTTINSLGFVAEIETFNNLECFFSTMPGNISSNVRKPPINTLNFTNLLPLSAVWSGDERCKHLNEPALLYTQTVGNTPFRLNIHIKDVGHAFIVGPTGSGKSVHLTFLAAQFMKYKNAQIFSFDKGGSSRVLTNLIGGTFYDLGSDNVRFQPLADCDNMKEREWCQEWLEELLYFEDPALLTPNNKAIIWTALSSIANAPRNMRTLSSFVGFAGGQNKAIKEALASFTGNGPYAKYFDGNVDSLNDSIFQVFEMEKISESKKAVAPALSYLFHKIEQKLKGDPSLIILDECWLFFDNPLFEAKIREWLKVLRKKNTSVIFATQELADIVNSNILNAVLGACATRIYLPNPGAISEAEEPLYKMFGLNKTEIYTVAASTPARQYFFKSPLGSRLYELSLSGLELSIVATAGEKDLTFCKQLEEKNLSTRDFNIQWFDYKGFDGKNLVEYAEENGGEKE